MEHSKDEIALPVPPQQYYLPRTPSNEQVECRKMRSSGRPCLT